MRELYLDQRMLKDEQGRSRCYDYYIIIDEMDVGPFSCESYGLRVAERGGGEALVPHITCSIPRMDELCELVLRNTVTPSQLRDVVCDWL